MSDKDDFKENALSILECKEIRQMKRVFKNIQKMFPIVNNWALWWNRDHILQSILNSTQPLNICDTQSNCSTTSVQEAMNSLIDSSSNILTQVSKMFHLDKESILNYNSHISNLGVQYEKLYIPDFQKKHKNRRYKNDERAPDTKKALDKNKRKNENYQEQNLDNEIEETEKNLDLNLSKESDSKI